MANKTIDPNETAERIMNEVPKAENEVVAGEMAESESAPVGEMPAPAPTEAPAEAPVEEAPVEPSRRDKFREGISKRNADLNMEDENAYYDYLDGQLSERDGYENAVNNIRSSIDESPEFAEMLAEACEQKNYSPIHYLLTKVRQGELDLDEIANNPDYADQYAEAQAESLKRKDEQQKMIEEGQKNFDESIAMMQRVRDERGLTDDQVNAAMEKAYQIFDDLKVNKISEETFNSILDSMNYNADVEQARNEGKAEGLNTRVKEQLRKPVARNRVGGAQTAMPEQTPRQEENTNSMFGL